MSTGKALIGILAGMAAGAVIGIILRPRNGDRLTRKVARESEDLANAINEKIDERLKELLKSASVKVRESKIQQTK